MKARYKKVVLYSPHLAQGAYRQAASYLSIPPFSHLAIAGPLRDAGYDVHIIDARWDLGWRESVREWIDDVVCAGVTAMTGPSVTDGLEFSAFMKSLRPGLPVIWGGWHPTFAAQQAVEDPRVDIVVRGFGERTVIEILKAIENDEPLSAIAGIHFRAADGSVHATPDRSGEDINHFPPPAYDLIQPERYVQTTGKIRLAGTIFSRGCPYACDFCLDSRNKYYGLTIDRMMADIEFWLGHGANHIRFYDGNFFLGKPRIVEFCKAIFERGYDSRFQWTATAVANRVVQMDDDLLSMLKRAGLEQVAIGAESGSQELLDRITNKTTVEHTIEAVRLLTRHGINQYLWLMVGYPDEPEDALERTLELATVVKKINPGVGLFVNFTTPLPGSEVFRIAVERGYVEAPKRFEDWAAFDYVRPNLIPITPAYARRVRLFLRYLELAFPHRAHGIAGALVHRAARWRVDSRNFTFPFEISVINGVRSTRNALRSTFTRAGVPASANAAT